MSNSLKCVLPTALTLALSGGCKFDAEASITDPSRDLSNDAYLQGVLQETKYYSRHECAAEISEPLHATHRALFPDADFGYICFEEAHEYGRQPVDVIVKPDSVSDTFALTEPYSFWAQWSANEEGTEERRDFVRYLEGCIRTEGCFGISLSVEGFPLVFPPELQASVEARLALIREEQVGRETSFPEKVESNPVDEDEDDQSFNVLLMGKHGTNVDTIILANVNEVRRRITLISVPRDLYYGGRRINAYFARKGIKAQVKAVEEVLGEKVEHYALVDMDDFVEIIDALGGLDVTLEKSLRDRTDAGWMDGKCMQLDYEPGTYHFDGEQALCIVRSRHSTSDFSRAARQQVVLKALREKLLSLDPGDSQIALGFLSQATQALQMDMSFLEVGAYYSAYCTYEVRSGFVLSGENVLSGQLIPVPYESARKITQCEDEGDTATCTEVNVIEALVPKGNDWSRIHKYVDGVLRN